MSTKERMAFLLDMAFEMFEELDSSDDMNEILKKIDLMERELYEVYAEYDEIEFDRYKE